MTIALSNYSSARTVTITLASLASSTSLTSGRESTFIQSSAINAIDYQIGGIITASSTGATASRQIEVWSYGSWDGTNYSAGATGSDAAFSPTNTKTLLKLITIIPTVATASQAYNWGPFSIAQVYGGTVPPEWGVAVFHNMGANLSATSGNHSVLYTPIQFTSS